tara:strand:+ start:130 stop:1206 length:1077 start_codon:yes stop_codon:yes gene_type:complete
MKIASHQLQRKSRYSNIKKLLDEDLFNSNWIEVNTKKISKKKCNINFIDLFSGAGGISLGFEKCGFKKIASFEIDKDASATIRKNFPNSLHFEDDLQKVTNRKLKEIFKNKKIDIVCGGPPCNGFSVAGYRNPDDPRNFLFREFMRFIKFFKPKVFMMENVPGILTMSNGEVKDLMLSEFAKLGYENTSVRILEAANFEVPQMRTRAIFIGNLKGNKNHYPKIINQKENYLKIEDHINDLKDHPRDPQINHEWTKHSKEFEKRISKVKPGESLYEGFRDAYKRQYLGYPSMAIKENHGGTHIHPQLNRVISAREMARLQTFPDNFIFSGSMKRAMWQVGNAVPVNFAHHIGLAIKSMF